MDKAKRFNTDGVRDHRTTKLRGETADDGRFYYVVVGGNGETLSTSQMYPTRQHRDRAMGEFETAVDRDGVDAANE